MSVISFLKDHIWVPIVAGCAFLLIIVFVVWCIYRRRHRDRLRTYLPLTGSSLNGKEELGFSESLELSMRTRQAKEKETALLRCQFYLRTSHDYEVYSQYQALGWRLDKYWFIVRESRGQEDFLLSMLPYSNTCSLPMTQNTALNLQQLFAALKHPYLQFIRTVAFDTNQRYSVVVQPFSSKGSLRDLIYGTSPLDSDSKQNSRPLGRPLSSAAIAKYGRQVLEALLFLKSKGFPPCVHLHVGNVIVYSRVCRLSGYEQTMLGLNPKLKKAFRNNEQDAEVILFGHMIYEMATGLALPRNASRLTDKDYRMCKASADVVALLKFIFPSEDEDRSYPKVKELAQSVFFEQFKPKEIQHYDASAVTIPAVSKPLLKAVRRGKIASTGGSKRRRESGPRYPDSIASDSSRPASVLSAPSPMPKQIAPPPPPPPPAETRKAAAPKERTALLSDIRKGASLKKTVDVRDRSAPHI
ncbi:slowpoke-binding protein-like [Oscarella lobularis]|uniref:slowpoke-binding protein-like n=1 Tax=Oscarella lobularis TaxID=121494 RepID=UPI00331329AF